MLPTFDLGPWQISTYSAVYILVLLVAGMYAFHRLLTGLGQPPEVIMRGLFLAILGGFVGQYLVRVVLVVQRFLQSGELVWRGGSSFIGMLLGGTAVGALYCPKYDISLPRTLDRVAPALALGQAIGRWGCLAAGCCYGKPTDSWLGVHLRNIHGEWAVRYPTQLMASAVDLLIFGLLLLVERLASRRYWHFDGLLFLLYVDLYSLKRFLLEFLRGDVLPVWGPITWVHVYTLTGMFLSTGLIVWNLRRVIRRDGGFEEPPDGLVDSG